MLDAYLCAAGMSQLLEDHLDRDATGARRLGRALGSGGVARDIRSRFMANEIAASGLRSSCPSIARK